MSHDTSTPAPGHEHEHHEHVGRDGVEDVTADVPPRVGHARRDEEPRDHDEPEHEGDDEAPSAGSREHRRGAGAG